LPSLFGKAVGSPYRPTLQDPPPPFPRKTSFPSFSRAGLGQVHLSLGVQVLPRSRDAFSTGGEYASFSSWTSSPRRFRQQAGFPLFPLCIGKGGFQLPTINDVLLFFFPPPLMESRVQYGPFSLSSLPRYQKVGRRSTVAAGQSFS